MAVTLPNTEITPIQVMIPQARSIEHIYHQCQWFTKPAIAYCGYERPNGLDEIRHSKDKCSTCIEMQNFECPICQDKGTYDE